MTDSLDLTRGRLGRSTETEDDVRVDDEECESNKGGNCCEDKCTTSTGELVQGLFEWSVLDRVDLGRCETTAQWGEVGTNLVEAGGVSGLEGGTGSGAGGPGIGTDE